MRWGGLADLGRFVLNNSQRIKKCVILSVYFLRRRIMSDKQIEYSVFCIENVAKELGKSGSELFQILNSSGLLHSYIIPSYEALHTQSKQYIVDEIISVLKERNLVA